MTDLIYLSSSDEEDPIIHNSSMLGPEFGKIALKNLEDVAKNLEDVATNTPLSWTDMSLTPHTNTGSNNSSLVDMSANFAGDNPMMVHSNVSQESTGKRGLDAIDLTKSDDDDDDDDIQVLDSSLIDTSKFKKVKIQTPMPLPLIPDFANVAPNQYTASQLNAYATDLANRNRLDPFRTSSGLRQVQPATPISSDNTYHSRLYQYVKNLMENVFLPSTSINHPRPADLLPPTVSQALNMTIQQMQMERQRRLAPLDQELTKLSTEEQQIHMERGMYRDGIMKTEVTVNRLSSEKAVYLNKEGEENKPRINAIDRAVLTENKRLNLLREKFQELDLKAKKINGLLTQIRTRRSSFDMIPSINDMLREYIRNVRIIPEEVEFVSEHMVQLAQQGQMAVRFDERANGYTTNIYDRHDTTNLQDLLDNIQPDIDTTDDDNLEKTPPEMMIQLLKHQRIGLEWLKKMESSKQKGSILADDMGLGKTVQSLALMVANKPTNSEDSKTTLIIAPVSLLRQWKAEIETKLRPDCQLSVELYHADTKKSLSTFEALCHYDVILTSYQTVASEFKKHFKTALNSIKGSHSSLIPDLASGGKDGYISPLYQNKGIFHRIILDEAHNIKNKATKASKAVYLIQGQYRLCLSGTPMQNNLDELYPLLRFLRIKPYERESVYKDDILLPMKNFKENYSQHDENRAKKKLQALLKAILLRRSKNSKIDGKPILTLPAKNIKEVACVMTNTEREFYQALEATAKQEASRLLNSKGVGAFSSVLTLLLRLRQACCHDYLVRLGKNSNDNNGADKTAWIARYNGATNLPSIAVKRIETGLDERDQTEDGTMGDLCCPICFENPTDEKLRFLSPCGHSLCGDCLPEYLERRQDEGNSLQCLTCREMCKRDEIFDFDMFDKVHLRELNKKQIKDIYEKPAEDPDKGLTKIQRVRKLIEQDGEFVPSGKINKCFELIEKIMSENAEEKIIIFSQFTSLFDVMDFAFKEKKIDFLRYDGSMKVDEKDSCIKRFYQSDTRVLLISLKSGNVGLTLTCANHVIIMDPFWNPFVEEQAQDRAHRIGQKREVHIHRLLIEGTVESRIMELQREKKELIESALDERGMKTVSNLGRRELGYLFGLNGLQD